MKTRDSCFCEFVCDEFKETDNNSWGDCSIYYVCKRENYGNRSANDWSKQEIPRKCKYKTIYNSSTKEKIDLLSSVGMYKKIIERLEKERQTTSQKLNEISNEINEYKRKILELEKPFVCADADIMCAFQSNCTAPATCMSNKPCKHQRKRK